MRLGFEPGIPLRIRHLLPKPHPYPLDNSFRSLGFCGESRATSAVLPRVGATT
jgi:hypothetical protein